MVRSALGTLLIVWLGLPVFAGEGLREDPSSPQPNVIEVSELLRRSAESPLGPGTAELLRAVADLLDKEPAHGVPSRPVPAVAASPSAAAPPIDPTTPAATVQRRRLVIRLSYAPAADVAKAVEEFFDGEPKAQDWDLPTPNVDGVVFVPEPISNSLLISGPPKVVDSLIQLVAKLDTRPDMVMVSICVAELVLSSGDSEAGDSTTPAPPTMQEDGAAWLAGAEKSGRLEVLSRPQIMTLDNQPAFIQVGSTVPTVESKPATKGSGKVDRSEPAEIGLSMSLTPRISPAEGLVVMDLDVRRKSVVNRNREGGPVIQETTLRTIIAAEEGQTVVQGGLLEATDEGRRQLIIAVTPRINPTR